jgi:hypothetical protein
MESGMEKYTSEEMVNRPPHYRFGGYELLEVIKAKLRESKMDAVQSALWIQLIQYLFRFDMKGKPFEDLNKAKFYLNDLYKETEKTNRD